MSELTLLTGDCRELLPTLPERSIQCVITSPPFFGLRSYLPDGHDDKPREIGLEQLHDCMSWARDGWFCNECYVCAIRRVFEQIRRVLRDDGVVFLNLGDSYAAGKTGRDDTTGADAERRARVYGSGRGNGNGPKSGQNRKPPAGLKPKDLIGIPWRVALALQADGYYLRSDCIWSKPNPMPESVTDRPTRSHEYVFLLSKSERYFWDQEAVREQTDPKWEQSHYQYYRHKGTAVAQTNTDRNDTRAGVRFGISEQRFNGTRNLRSVWTIATAPYTGAHFATFPPALVERCLLAGTSPQACEVCGAPWARVVEQSITGSQHRSPKDKTADDARGARGFDSSRLHTQYFDYQTTTTGWQPTCHCPDNTGSARCTILDPFAGSGTVAKVAIEHNRNAVLIDLSSDYASLQLARTNGVQRRLWLDE